MGKTVIVDVAVEDTRWNALNLEDAATRALLAVRHALGYQGVALELSILGCDDGRIATLNQDFRSKPMPTNVLSWPSQERAASVAGDAPLPFDRTDPELGDIAIAYETCINEAKAGGKEPGDHVMHLLIHGILHLFGYDHETEADAALMEGLETEILATMGINDPYEQRD